jgi:hypothetical protein
LKPWQYSVMRFLEYHSIMGLTAIRLNVTLIFTVTPTSEDLFAPLEGCLCLLQMAITILHSFFAQYIEPSIVSIFSFSMVIPLWDSWKHCKANNDISCMWVFHCSGLIAVFDSCTVGTTWEQLCLLSHVSDLSGKSGMKYQSNPQHCKLTWQPVLNHVSSLLIHEMPGYCARFSQGWVVVFIRKNAEYESNHRKSRMYIPSSSQGLNWHLLPCETHHHHSHLSWQQVTCTKQRFLIQNTPDNRHNCVNPHWAYLRYMLLCLNAHASDVDSYSTHSNSTQSQLQRKEEGNCYSKNSDIG